jgi:hypothetical protein
MGYPVGMQAAPGAGVPPFANNQVVIDQALEVIYSHFHRLGSRLAPDAVRVMDLAELQRGTLGEDLARLAAFATGQRDEAPERVLEAVEAVLELLFWPAAAEDFVVPRQFWETALGSLLARAKRRALAAEKVVDVDEAARQLGIGRPTIDHWLDDRLLSFVSDTWSGRTVVLQRDVDRLRQVAAILDA